MTEGGGEQKYPTFTLVASSLAKGFKAAAIFLENVRGGSRPADGQEFRAPGGFIGLSRELATFLLDWSEVSTREWKATDEVLVRQIIRVLHDLVEGKRFRVRVPEGKIRGHKNDGR